ncbi:hypothetical protein VOLCADRAFT_92652 [Volvox carteri f. nagariensis]|uniref:Uncharacterized protein n=1 Tax=Volvox carteri f. nagariensis TaxID=3068 RepID=D8U074_VOLCA|nr:uncharacterized protein VOLCADRAFT_92652 [Volvox carteri f. nagariensis]EFJ46814.1 hypothetical protein VOLCADRAFT_92652 [Volvox carteri f. nagariensis]|eukprot:XP_002952023.1 hypothetical protein VOLCADRAFT_92652 [Volvox carteri f. nagariensis]
MDYIQRARNNPEELANNGLMVQLIDQIAGLAGGLAATNQEIRTIKHEQAELKTQVKSLMKSGRGVYYDAFGLVHQNGLFYLDSMRIFTTGNVDESRIKNVLREADVNIKRIRLLGSDPNKDRKTWCAYFDITERPSFFRAAEVLRHQKVGIDDNLTQAGRIERKRMAPLRQDIMRQGAIPVWRNGAELYIKERPGGKAQPYGTRNDTDSDLGSAEYGADGGDSDGEGTAAAEQGADGSEYVGGNAGGGEGGASGSRGPGGGTSGVAAAATTAAAGKGCVRGPKMAAVGSAAPAVAGATNPTAAIAPTTTSWARGVRAPLSPSVACRAGPAAIAPSVGANPTARAPPPPPPPEPIPSGHELALIANNKSKIPPEASLSAVKAKPSKQLRTEGTIGLMYTASPGTLERASYRPPAGRDPRVPGPDSRGVDAEGFRLVAGSTRNGQPYQEQCVMLPFCHFAFCQTPGPPAMQYILYLQSSSAHAMWVSGDVLTDLWTWVRDIDIPAQVTHVLTASLSFWGTTPPS